MSSVESVKKTNMFKNQSFHKRISKFETVGRDKSQNMFNNNKGTSAFSKSSIKENTEKRDAIENIFKEQIGKVTRDNTKKPKEFLLGESEFPTLCSQKTKNKTTSWNYSSELKKNMSENDYKKIQEEGTEKVINKVLSLGVKEGPLIKLPNITRRDEKNKDSTHLSEYKEYQYENLGSDLGSDLGDEDSHYIYGWEVDRYLEERELEKRWARLDDEDCNGQSDNDEDDSTASDLEY